MDIASIISRANNETRKVLSSKRLIEHILSYIPLESMCICVRVCQNWNLVIKYIVPIPLINLKLLSLGELVYWLPGENRFPKTVLLKLRFSAGIPTFLQIITSAKNNNNNRKNQLKNGYNKNGYNKNTQTQTQSSYASSYQMIDLNEILFVVQGHWTPIFDRLRQNEDQFDMNASQFFHRTKCFSIVTNTYMTYDFISFNQESGNCIVNTMRCIVGHSIGIAKKMAIYAKANRKYVNHTDPLVFEDTLSALNYEMFVLIVQDCMSQIGHELNLDIPSVIQTEANPSLLYPMLLDEEIEFTNWVPWVRAQILDILKAYGYLVNVNVNEIDNNVNISNEYGIINDEDTTQGNHDNNVNLEDLNTLSIDKSKDEKIEAVTPIAHMRRQSSLFGLKSFPVGGIDLFSGLADDSDDEAYANKIDMHNSANYSISGNGPQTKGEAPECIVM